MQRTKLHCRLILIASLLLAGTAAHAQAAPPLTTDHDPIAAPEGDAAPAPAPPAGTPTGEVKREAGGQFILRQSTEEVVLNATVVDQSQQLIENLDKSAFQVYEDGVQQTILGFRREDIPVSLGILIDSSGSMYNKVDAVRTSAMDLIKASNAQDETFIVNFSEEAYIDQDLTSDVNKLSAALNLFHVAGGTAIYDTVVASADYLSQNAKKPKQVLLIITDGDDRDSTSNLETTIRRVQDLDGPVVYCIGLLFGSDDMDRDSKLALAARATNPGRPDGRSCFLSQAGGGCGRHRAAGGAGHSQPVHDLVSLHAAVYPARLPADPCRREGKGLRPAYRAYAQRILP